MSLVPFVHLDTSLAGVRVDDRLPLGDDELHHLRRVLRLRPGAAIEVSDGQGGLAAASLEADGLVVTAPPSVVARRSPRVTLAQGLPKARKLDEVVRQVTELGVDAIQPVLAERSVVRAEAGRSDRIVERAAAVARAAAEQARGVWRPTVAPVLDTTSWVRAVTEDGPLPALLVAHPGGTGLVGVLRGLREAPVPPAELVIAIGPEGGFSPREVDLLEAAGALLVGLGPTILRTEHAGAAALAVTKATLGHW